MSSSIKGVIFDFNGTLFFDNDKHVQAWNQISKLIRGHGISDEELHEHFNGVPNQMIIDYLFEGHASIEDIYTYSQLKEKYYRSFCVKDPDSFHLVMGAEDFMNRLKKLGIPFTIASASIKENMDFFIKSFHLSHYINPDQNIYDNGMYKDKIAMFQAASQAIHVPIEDCLIIEDSKSGIINAYEAGCRHIIVVDSSHRGQDYAKLKGVIKVIKDFKTLV